MLTVNRRMLRILGVALVVTFLGSFVVVTGFQAPGLADDSGNSTESVDIVGVKASTGRGGCHMAIPFRDLENPDDAYAVTAGHCVLDREDAPIERADGSGVQIGSVIKQGLSADQAEDLALIKLEDGFVGSRTYNLYGEEKTLDGFADPELDSTVCMVTGDKKQCGTLEAKDKDFSLSTGHEAIQNKITGFCLERGDSGAPVVSEDGTKAIGIISGGGGKDSDNGCFATYEPVSLVSTIWDT